MDKPVSLIIDTDVGNDIDDALALALCHTLQTMGQCRLIGVTICKDDLYAAMYVSVLNSFYGRAEIPIGIVKNGNKGKPGEYLRHVVHKKDLYGRCIYPCKVTVNNPPPEAVILLRQLLAEQPDQSVVIVMIGPATNMARLLATKPDEYSSLSGVELFARKVKLVSAMAADFSEEVQKNPTMENREFNIHVDIPSAEFFFTHCPVEVVFSGYEVGCKILYPAESILQDYQWTDHHPVADAYQVYAKMPYNRPCWDLTSVLYAVHPDKDYFGLSKRGWACVEKTGIVRFREDPEGLHRYLTVTDGQAETLVALFSQLCSCQHPDRIKHKKIADTILSIKSDKPSQVKTSSTDNF